MELITGNYCAAWSRIVISLYLCHQCPWHLESTGCFCFCSSSPEQLLLLGFVVTVWKDVDARLIEQTLMLAFRRFQLILLSSPSSGVSLLSSTPVPPVAVVARRSGGVPWAAFQPPPRSFARERWELESSGWTVWPCETVSPPSQQRLA